MVLTVSRARDAVYGNTANASALDKMKLKKMNSTSSAGTASDEKQKRNFQNSHHSSSRLGGQIHRHLQPLLLPISQMGLQLLCLL